MLRFNSHAQAAVRQFSTTTTRIARTKIQKPPNKAAPDKAAARKATKPNAPPQEIKLTLAPREAERDLQILKGTFAPFSEMLHAQSLEGKAVDADGSNLLDIRERLAGAVAERVLEMCTAQGQPRGLVHLLVRLQPAVQFSAHRSKEALRMVRQKGDAVDLRQLRRAMQQREGEDAAGATVPPLAENTANAVAVAPDSAALPQSALHIPPLQLDVSDVDDTIALCVQRGDMDEALKWFITMQDSLRLSPADSTCGLMLPALIRRKKWEALFYVLGEMRALGLAVPPRAYDILLGECAKYPADRWRDVQRLLTGLLEASSAAGLDEVLLPRNIHRGLAVLRGERQHEAVVGTWAALRGLRGSLAEGGAGSSASRESMGAGLLWDKDMVHVVGVCAVVLGHEEAVAQVLAGPNGGSREEGEEMKAFVRRSVLAMKEPSSSSGTSASVGARCGVALSWLLAHGEPDLARELYAALGGLEGDAHSALLLSLGACLSDAAVSADLEAASSIVHAALSGLQGLAGAGGVSVAAMVAGAEAGSLVETSTPATVAPVHLTEPMAAAFIALFGKTQDAKGIALVLLHCAGQAVPMSEVAFTQASQTLLQQGDLGLVLRLFESYLLQLDASEGGGKLAAVRNSAVFSPVLAALAHMGELDTMMTVLLKELPRRKCLASPLLYVTAINACRHAKRYNEGFRLFDLATRTEFLDKRHGERNDLTALIATVLQLCAEGRMGKQALRVVAWVDEAFPRLSVLRGDLREATLELVVTALSSPQSIVLLPSFLDILRSGARPIDITRRFYVVCLSAALAANNEAVYQALLAQRHDSEIEAYKEEIIADAQRMVLERFGTGIEALKVDNPGMEMETGASKNP